jgi:hypothetical protein
MKKKPKSVPWGDHVLRGKRQRTTATPMTTASGIIRSREIAVRSYTVQILDDIQTIIKALSDGGLSHVPETPNA